jgi:hypothetical protein
MKGIKLLFSAVFALMIGAAAQHALGANGLAVAGTVLSAGALTSYFNPTIPGVFNAITVELWQSHIEEEIFKDNVFIQKSYNANEFVLGGKVVHIPQSGGSGNVVKNRSSLPATVRKRTDDDIVYVLNNYSTDPVLIPNVETKELTYDKRQSVLEEDMNKIKQIVAEDVLYGWLHTPAYGSYSAASLPNAAKFLTTGASAPATAPGAIGNRRIATLNDLQRLQSYFRTQNRWFEGKMHIMLPPSMLLQLFPADSVVTATYMQNVTEAERRMGIIAKAQGFNIWSRSTVGISQANGTLRAPGEAGAVTDGEYALAWYEQSVEHAMGSIDAFESLNNPLYYGDIYSFEVRMGARARRSGFEGIAILRQDTV